MIERINRNTIEVTEKLASKENNLLGCCESPYWHSIANLKSHLKIGYKTLKLKILKNSLRVTGNPMEISNLFNEMLEVF